MEAIHEQIRKRAYLYFCERGFAEGHEEEDWIRAEKELIAATLDETDGHSPAGTSAPVLNSGSKAPPHNRE